MKINNIIDGLLDLKMRDNTTLSFNYCETKEVNSIFIFLPGFGGDYHQYKRLFYSFLQANNASVFFMTMRGESLVDKSFFHVSSADQFLHDIQDLFFHIRNTYPTIPIFVCAHSGGSSLALRFVTRQKVSDIAGLFLIESVFPGDFDVDRDPISWVYKLINFRRHWKVVKLKEKPFVENKWDFRFSVIKFIMSELFPFLDHWVVLKVRENKTKPWKRYTAAYQNSYACSYFKSELKKKLRKLQCPVWIVVGENDEHTLAQAVMCVFNWNISPDYLREIYFVKGVTHFGSLPLVPSLITRWLRQENTIKKNLNSQEIETQEVAL